MAWIFLAFLLPLDSGALPFTQGKVHHSGFFDLYWDTEAGKLYLALDTFDQPFLLHTQLVTGLGSNDVGLDRGKPGGDALVHFHRVGNRVFLIQPNTTYRAATDNPAEARAVAESFASSTLWSAEIKAREGERVFVDLDGLAMVDRNQVAAALRETGEGSYALNRDLSYYIEGGLKAFPHNTEVEVSLTFRGEPKGRQVPTVAADAEAVTLRQRLSFIRLPDDAYETRPYHPNSGGFHMQWYDYAAPLDADLARRVLVRHRLTLDPRTGEPTEPIVYYVDNGAPEAVRAALVEGASWWAQAFEAAGFKNAFQVKVMPEDMDPMDVRYNVIQWVHRATRGWSYGSSIVDPRTGEILKGHVTLGSLRVRQDRLIFEGMLPRDADGGFADGVDPVALSLARIRQLAAHEVGHTLGLAHNFVASAEGRASVMDYPAPLVRLEGNRLVTEDVYDHGIGAWDKVSIQCLYAPMKDPMAEMNALLDKAAEAGLHFLADEHSRSLGAMHPDSHLWDNGADALQEMSRMSTLRAHLLAHFGAANLRPDVPAALLEEVLVPVYLGHRFQLQAVAKSVGGAWFEYGFNDGKPHQKPVAAARQERALEMLGATLAPAFLDLPDALVDAVPPRPPGYAHHRELFDRRTGDGFDHLALAETSAQMTLDALLHPDRLNRVFNQHALHPELPGIVAVLEHLRAPLLMQDKGRHGVLRRQVNHLVVNRLIEVVTQPSLREEVRALVYDALSQWDRDLKQAFKEAENAPLWQAHYRWLRLRIASLEEDVIKPSSRLKVPPGSPI